MKLTDAHIVLNCHGQLKKFGYSNTTGAVADFVLSSTADVEKLSQMTTRKGKQAGQRLMLSIVQVSNQLGVMDCEVQLKGWNISHNQGASVGFWLANKAQLDELENIRCRHGKTDGDELTIVAVEIGDDEQPVDQSKVVAVEVVKGGPLSKTAARIINEQSFWEFSDTSNKEEAEQFLKITCGVTQKRQIDHDSNAKLRFHRMMSEFNNFQNA